MSYFAERLQRNDSISGLGWAWQPPSTPWRAVQVVEALQLSRATFAKIRQNLVWAFGYNAVGIPIAAGALLPAYGIAFTPSIAGQARC